MNERVKVRTKLWPGMPRAVLPLTIIMTIVVAGCGNSTSDEQADSATSEATNGAASEETESPAPSQETESPAASETTESLTGTVNLADLPPDLAERLSNPGPQLCEGGGQYKIGYDVFSDTESFAVLTIETMQQQAEEIGCVELLVQVDNADAATAVRNTEIFVQQEVDGVVLLQVVAAAQPGIMRILDQEGIPVVSFNAAPGATVIDVNRTDLGVAGGRALAEFFKDTHPGETPYVILGTFAEGEGATEDMMEGLRTSIQEVLPSIPADQVLAIDTQADTTIANAQTAAVLGRVPNDAKVLIVGVNAAVSSAMVQAAKQDGRDQSVFAVGGATSLDEAKVVCASEQFVAGFALEPTKTPQGLLLPAVIAAIEGVDLPDMILTPTVALTRDEIANVYPDAGC